MDTLATEPVPPYRDHVGGTMQYIRDIVLGVNDGLVSIFLLVAGVVGAGFTSRQVLLASIAASIAGAISMAAGEYIATKSQDEVFAGEMELEREHLKYHRHIEIEELREMFGDMGLKGEQLESVIEALDRDDESILKVMMALEFGVVDTQRRSPYRAMALSGVLFLMGSMPSVLPFAFIDRPGIALGLAAVLTSAGLFAVGAIKTKVTRKNPWISGVENLLIGASGAVLSYAAGALFDAAV